MEYNLKLESEIKKLGFKKKEFSDKSGRWWEYKFKFKDFKCKLTVESDRKAAYLDIKVYDWNFGELKGGQYDTVKLFKCNLKTIKEIIKKYK